MGRRVFVIQLSAIGNNGAIGTGKSKGNEGEASSEFEALLNLINATEIEKIEDNPLLGLLNQGNPGLPFSQISSDPVSKTVPFTNQQPTLPEGIPPQNSIYPALLQQAEETVLNEKKITNEILNQTFSKVVVATGQTEGEYLKSVKKNLYIPVEGDLTQNDPIKNIIQGTELDKMNVKQPLASLSLTDDASDPNQNNQAESHPKTSKDITTTVFNPSQLVNGEFVSFSNTVEKTVASSQVRAEHFERDVQQILKSALTYSDEGVEAAFTLEPENLGKVEIKIALKDGQLTAEFFASQSSGKELLEKNVQVLRSALEAQGLQVEKINITQQHAASLTGAFSQRGDSNHRHGNGQQESKKRTEQAVLTPEIDYPDVISDSVWVSKINTTA